MKKHRSSPVIRWIFLTLALLAVSVTMAVYLTFVSTAGVPADHWGQLLYFSLTNRGFSPVFSTILAVSSIKVLDVVISVFLVRLAYRLTPGSIRKNEPAVM